MTDTQPLTQAELEEFDKQFPDGMAPKAIRKELVEYQKDKKLGEAGRKRKEIIRTKSGIKQVTKADLFLEEFLRNGGNATQAALVVFNCTSIESAASIGSQYLKNARAMARVYMEKSGYGYGKMLDIAAKKMEDSKNPEWWDRLMKMGGYEDFLTPQKAGVAVSFNLSQAHKTIASEYVDGEVITEVDDESHED